MKTLSFKFVELIPEEILENCVYISIEYSTAVHKCCCGCGMEVITPISPTDWKLIYDGETISLYPSIGNWSFDCKSHYFIKNNNIKWAESWSEEQIEEGRQEDKKSKTSFYSKKSKRTNKKNKIRDFWRGK